MTQELTISKLAEEIKNAWVEGIFSSQWALIETYHTIGNIIVSHPDTFKTKQDLALLSQKTQISERNLYRAIQFVKKYPEIDKLPEGKAISWTKIVNKYLPQPKEEIIDCEHDWTIVKFCTKCHKREEAKVLKDSKCPNIEEGHKGCIEFIDEVAKEKGTKFINYAKQIQFLHKILRAGFTFEQMNNGIDELMSSSFYQEKGFDFANLAQLLERKTWQKE